MSIYCTSQYNKTCATSENSDQPANIRLSHEPSTVSRLMAAVACSSKVIEN